MKKLWVLLPLALLLLVISCATTDDADSGGNGTISAAQKEVYESLQSRFEAGATLEAFISTDNNKSAVVLGDEESVSINHSDVTVIKCTPQTWPIILSKGGVWHVAGKDTKIKEAADEESICIVAAVYDTHGLYLTLNSGKIIYFHPEGANELGCFRFEASRNPSLSKDVICRIVDGKISTILPTGVDATQLIPTVGYRGKSLKIGGVEVKSGVTAGNYSMEVVIELTDFSGGVKSYDVAVSKVKRIPVVRIAIDGGQEVVEKKVYLSANITIEDPDLLFSTEKTVTLTTQIRGRGNSTWDMPKKPYRLKLAEKATIFGMSTDRDWSLLANYSDKTMLRNVTTFEMSRILGMSWTARCRPVELYINNTYRGMYMLTEHVKVSDERVNIVLAKKTDLSEELITGGYFLEIDERMGEINNFTTRMGIPINFKDPEKPTAEQIQYVKNYFQVAEDALYGSKFTDPTLGYAKYIDILSFVHNYIIQELTRNVDGNMRLSNYLVKSRGGKIAHSHVWDFDLAIGNCDYISTSTDGYQIKNVRWYTRLMKDHTFVRVLKQEWNKLYSQLYKVEMHVRESATQVDQAQGRNFQTWRILNEKVWPNPVALGSYNAELNYMLNYLNTRAKWLDKEIKGM